MPVGEVPLPVAVFFRVPASISAWVMTWLPVQLMLAPGSRSLPLAGVQVSGWEAGNIGSVTVTPLRVTLPVFFVATV